MPYRHETQDQDYTDLSSGRVLYSLPGAPAFPVRLASEMFQRAREHLGGGALALYDPTCGGAYHLAALGFLHGDAIRQIAASDADHEVLALARRNLGLLSLEGLDRRIAEIRGLLGSYGKPSHAGALESALRLRAALAQKVPAGTLQCQVFEANALDPQSMAAGLGDLAPDMVLSDVPYGNLTSWAAMPEENTAALPLRQMLDALQEIITARTVIVIASDKQQKVEHAGYRRLERFQVGKRQVTLLRRA